MPRFPWELASVRFTRAWVLLLSVRMVITGIIRTLARLMAITGRTGLWAACLSAPDRGIAVTGDAAGTTDMAGMVAPGMAIDPDTATGQLTDMAAQGTATVIGQSMVVGIAALPEAATAVVMRVAVITEMLPGVTMAVAVFTAAVEDSMVVAEAMAVVATGN